MTSLEDVLKGFVGRVVKVWTRYVEEPEEGVLIFFNAKPPYLLVIRGRDRKYRIYNWKEVVRIDCLEDTKI
jgi:hypothetical protein